jgi:hypothetical protein
MSYSAGILPIAIYKGELLVLLGRDRCDGQWSDFGGRSEAEDRGDPKATAQREMYEETMGAILDIDAIGARLQCNKCHMLIESRTMGGQVYFMYVMGVPFFNNYGAVFNKISRFARYIDAKRKYLEKMEICWFSFKDVLNAARGIGRTRMIPHPLRDVFAASVRLGADVIRNAWSLECYPSRRRLYTPNVSVCATPLPIERGRIGSGGTGAVSSFSL